MTALIIHSNDPYNPRVVYPYDPDEISEFSALEEALYIWWELTPYGRYWRNNLVKLGGVTFTYHTTEFAKVYRDECQHEYKVVM